MLHRVLISAQSTNVAVNKATPALFAKARNVHKICTILVNNYQGQAPKDRAALENLPGVGRKTANVVLAEAFG